MTDISTSVTFRERMTYATSRVALVSGWKRGILRAMIGGFLAFGALSMWSTAPGLVDALITTGATVAAFLVAPVWRFVDGFRTARIAHLVALVEELQARIPPTEGWVGIEHGGRYFAWDGPNLHDLSDRDPEPTPAGLPEALFASGYEASYNLPANLSRSFASGAKRLFETDRKTWRRTLVGQYGDQILIVKERKVVE